MTTGTVHRGIFGIALGLISASACGSDAKYPDPPRDSYAATTLTLRWNGRDSAVSAATVDPTFFAAGNAHALLGRLLVQSDRPPATRVAIVSEGLWRGPLGAQPSLIGSPITLNGETFIVVGVTPKSFDFPPGTGVWVQRGEPIGK